MGFSFAVPLDSDGFVRRECPTCGREFKWFSLRAEGTPADWVDPESYYCPYCGVPASGDAWFTQAQLVDAQQVAAEYASEAIRDELDDLARSVNRQGGLLRMEVSGGDPDAVPPPPLSEPNDMVAVAPPCHPFEPVKILEGWDEPLHCLVCGARYAVD